MTHFLTSSLRLSATNLALDNKAPNVWLWPRTWVRVVVRKKTGLCGKNSQVADPLPHPPVWEIPVVKTSNTIDSRVSSVVKIRKHLTILTQYRMMNTTSNMKMNRWCQVANLSMDNSSRRREFNFSLRGLHLNIIFVFHHFNKNKTKLG